MARLRVLYSAVIIMVLMLILTWKRLFERVPERVPKQASTSTAVTRLSNGDISNCVNVIMNVNNGFHNLMSQCRKPSSDRYGYLKSANNNILFDSNTPAHQKPKYFFALDLHQSTAILPRLLGSIVEAMRFLGPENCVLSIVEGRSTDGTLEVLTSVQSQIEAIGARYVLQVSRINSEEGEHEDRIKSRAELRNIAIAPFINSPDNFDPDTTVIFINEIALCTEDILELIHQRKFQDADLACAMDWEGTHFRDIFTGRTMWGDTFWELSQDGNYRFSEHLFWNDPVLKAQYEKKESFQAFSCWSGMAAFTPEPFIKHGVKFRSNYENECVLGDAIHLAKDMRKLGYNKVAVVPSVNVAYNEEDFRSTKERVGTVTKLVDKSPDHLSARIRWDTNNPVDIKCMSSFRNPSWIPWDEGLSL